MPKFSLRKLISAVLLTACLVPLQATAMNDAEWKQPFMHGQKLFQQGKYMAALRQYDHALEINPNAWEIYLHKAHLYEKMGMANHVIANYDAAMAMHPRLAQAYLQRAAYFERQNKLPQASYDLDEGLRHLPYNADLRLARAQFRLRYANDKKMGCQSAMEDLNLVIRIRPKQSPAYQVKLRCHREAQDYMGALNTLDQMIANGHQQSNVYLTRGLLHRILEHDSLAMKDLNMAIEKNSNSAVAYFERGEMYLEAGEGMCKMALEDFKMACKKGLSQACKKRKACVPPAETAPETAPTATPGNQAETAAPVAPEGAQSIPADQGGASPATANQGTDSN